MRKPTKAELGWKRHRGGKCPVPIFTEIEVRYRNGTRLTHEVEGLMADPCIWEHMTGFTSEIDIMAYRILE